MERSYSYNNSDNDYNNGVYICKKSISGPCVLYKDYNGFWAPLSNLYWSSSSKFLVSRHPYSCIEEILSSYCPQCLTRYMEDELLTYENRCSSCFQCPQCASVLTYSTSFSNDNSSRFLCCGYCLWRSDIKLSLTGEDKTSIESSILEKERENEGFEYYKNIQQKLIQESNFDFPLSSNKSLKSSLKRTEWRVENMEELIESNLTQINKNDNNINNINNMDDINIDMKDDNEKYNNSTNDYNLTTLSQKLQVMNLLPNCLSSSIPSRVKLRSKRTLRCRYDVDNGKMSILVQPKTFPLEGDSSLKIQRGKWWIKDASAIHEVPSILIKQLPNREELLKGNVSFLQIKLINPKDIDMKIKLKCPNNNNNNNNNLNIEKTPIDCSVLLKLQANPIKSPNNENDITSEQINEDCLTLVLNGFEDELLRDTEESNNNIEKLNINDHDSNINKQTEWTFSLFEHTSTIIIPVFIIDINNEENKNKYFQLGIDLSVIDVETNKSSEFNVNLVF
jgi:dynactin-4